ncbi:uncharacterized protein LOC104421059 isoform X1 [Eucalyptus grandis]|uniref:Uncharacterized protein n=2 Tax=Eucalyptus grandis TaxID=71139 RepID=A0ACC3J122_EUCGR|nr:uncharacterized protein LOC104421059 isoform X1 [Eucalyptus grandis]KAK3407836.1 hypothetical protein EUGRSUZ_J00191 [Eucalyptus grandis]
MAVSLNSVVGFGSQVQVRSRQVSTSYLKGSEFKQNSFLSHLSMPRLGKARRELHLSVAESDQFSIDSAVRNSGDAEKSVSEIGVESSRDITSETSSGPVPNSNPDQDQSLNAKSQSTPKRSPLTARERLRAARVLSRYSEAKTLKSEMGSKVLDALKESDRGKRRSGLPEAPTNMFDDSKRGMPKKGLTFQFPGGVDLFVVAFSFVFISTVMFATTYLVWKVGAIHFNEY